jgi:hypothetical protein
MKLGVVQLPGFLCKMGVHRWKHYGERKLIVWKEPGMLPGTKAERHRHVFTKRECLRCGVRQEREFVENLDGTLSAVGWDVIDGKDE